MGVSPGDYFEILPGHNALTFGDESRAWRPARASQPGGLLKVAITAYWQHVVADDRS